MTEIAMNELIMLFSKKFASEPLLIEAPGRINLIGEHTDYNDGWVLPAAIDKSVKLAIQKSGSSHCTIIACDINDEYSFSLEQEISPVQQQWVNYFLGVVSELQKRNAPLVGFNLIFTSNIPIGAGMSSSAAIECGIGYALDQLLQLNISPLDLALMAQQAEHKFIGVKCGIMDQFTSIMGKKGHVVQLDCRSLKYAYYPADFKEYQLVLFDSGIKHNLANSAYNARRKECEQAFHIARKVNANATSLRDISLDQLLKVKVAMDPVVYNRAKYIIEENERVLEVCNLLRTQDIENVGRLMFETHNGLMNLYNVSCKEIDLLVALARESPAIIGARMMGGGFGGCTINIIKSTDVEDVVASIEKAYKSQIHQELKVYHVALADGVHRIVL